jgi:hypothetical protein
MTDRLANSLSAASTGLQTKDAYKRKREEIQQAAALGKSAVVAPPPDGSGAAGEEKAGAAAKKKKKKAASSVLSFGDELEEESISPRLQTKGMGKDTTSNVSFLKPNEREAQVAAQATDVAKREYLVMQEKAKAEKITLAYTFRSEVTQRELPIGFHQGSITVLKGATADEVSRAVRAEVETLGEKFELPAVAGVKDSHRDLLLVLGAAGQRIGSFVVPGSLALVELLASQWTEKTPLFDDFKAGVIVTERRWFDKMRHTFPYSQWIIFDVHKTYSYKEFIANRNSGSGVNK